MAQLWLTATLEVATHEPIYKPNLNHPELSERLAAELREGSKKAFVIFADEALAAYATFRIEQEAPIFAPRRYLYVVDLDVSARFRRQDLSRLLMAEVEAYALAQGVKRIKLSTAFADPRAATAWERHGFTPHMLLMHKDL